MALTKKQSQILRYCKANGGITKKQAVVLIDDYYHNADFLVGQILSRMVNAGLLTRVKPGVFIAGGQPKKSDANQIKLEL